MQTLFLKYFPVLIFVHFIVSIFMFVSVLSYFENVSLFQAGAGAVQSLFIKALFLSIANQVLPVYLYFKWSRES
ncbi:hypothetical protein Oweho_2642 [Owenweeksia hongkongensis DSM 17368]|uniref:Uncharacterized protein n=1 Tax=Owenweeksia hongkongensis (strain DSM 17368 / CIP 108786 / JCM 12287 / NRRL B-23963 / UST20020801) TaxID=926562 RepID=G8R8Z8_OWEHD|nr:hypothetical protein Oweho_2642 [Owenweeksia hongkongensis DSM 17368]